MSPERTMPDFDPRAVRREADAFLFTAKVEDAFKRAGFTVYRQALSNRCPDRLRTGPPAFIALAGPRLAAVRCPPDRQPTKNPRPNLDDLPANVEAYIVRPGDLRTLPGRILAQLGSRPHREHQ